MYIISLFSIGLILINVLIALIGFVSGTGALIAMCVSAAVCILCGAGLLIKLLVKGVFSLLKCVLIVPLLMIPVINIFVLAAIIIASVKVAA